MLNIIRNITDDVKETVLKMVSSLILYTYLLSFISEMSAMLKVINVWIVETKIFIIFLL